jgi:dCTP deaminase
MILSGRYIKARGIISPLVERTEYGGVTHGLGTAGYDVRIEFDVDGPIDARVILPGEFCLGSTIERFRMPRDVIGIVHDKSSWARRGLAVQNTVIEAGWEGHLTLELTNHSKERLAIMRGVGIAQIVFHQINEPVPPYEGKYQGQGRGPQEAR